MDKDFWFLKKYYRYLHLFECCFVGCLHVESIICIFPTSFLQTYCHIWMNYNKGNQPPWKQNAEEIYGVFGHKKISHSPKEMTEIWPAWDDSNVRQTRLRRPVLCPAELQADIVNYSTLCKRCKHVDRIENGEMTRIFRYIFQSACQNRKYGLQYLCYKREMFNRAVDC